MPNLWICGVTQNNVDNLRDMLDPLSTTELFNDSRFGVCFVDGGSTDDTKRYLKEIAAICLHRKWTNDHDFSMNEYLRAGPVRHGDWVLQVDSSERIHPDFVRKLLNGMLENFEQQGINTVYQRSKPLLFKFHDDQIFFGSPHWGIQGMRKHVVDISKFDGFEDDKTYLWSTRNNNERWITNGFKYYYVYGRSNHMWLIYDAANYPNSSDQLIYQHERKRNEFRHFCRNVVGLTISQDVQSSLEQLDEFLKQHKHLPLMEWAYPELLDFINYEKVIANYYRYQILGHDIDEIKKTENTWKLSDI